MSPGTAPWWRAQADAARSELEEYPDSSTAAYRLALAIARCRSLGANPGGDLAIKQALLAAAGYVEAVHELRSRLTDAHWLASLLPTEMADYVDLVLCRRVDLLLVQLLLDEVFDAASRRYERKIDAAVDDVVDALLEMDAEMHNVWDLLSRYGVVAIAKHRSGLPDELRGEWWLGPAT